MNLLKHCFSLYVRHNIHVALMVVCFYLITVLEWEMALNYNHFGIVFLGSFLGYSYIKRPSFFLASLCRFYRVLDGAVYLTAGLFFVTMVLTSSPVEVTILMIAGALVFFYVFPQTRFTNLRSLNGLKIYIVSFSWVVVTGLFPFETFELTGMQSGYLLQRFLLILLATLPFEIRDMESDKPQLNTLAQTLGIKGVQLLGLGLALLICSMSFVMNKIGGVEAPTALFLLPFYLGSLMQIKRIKSPFFVSFWVELIPLFGLIFLYLRT